MMKVSTIKVPKMKTINPKSKSPKNKKKFKLSTYNNKTKNEFQSSNERYRKNKIEITSFSYFFPLI